MQVTLKLRILTPDNHHPGEFLELYRNTLFLDSALTFDYQRTVDTFISLYPGKQILVEYSIFNF